MKRHKQGTNPYIQHKTFSLEKGFVSTQNSLLRYRNTYIASLGIKFCQTQPPTIIPLVYEFYANYSMFIPNSVFVKRKQVSITPEVINEFYSLENIDYSFQKLVQGLNEAHLEDVLKKLCIEGTTWTKGSHGSLTIPSDCLRAEAKVLYHFLTFQPMTSTHDTLVHQERVY